MKTQLSTKYIISSYYNIIYTYIHTYIHTYIYIYIHKFTSNCRSHNIFTYLFRKQQLRAKGYSLKYKQKGFSVGKFVGMQV